MQATCQTDEVVHSDDEKHGGDCAIAGAATEMVHVCPLTLDHNASRDTTFTDHEPAEMHRVAWEKVVQSKRVIQ